MTLYAMISCHLHVDAARYLEYLHSTKKGRVGGSFLLLHHNIADRAWQGWLPKRPFEPSAS